METILLVVQIIALVGVTILVVVCIFFLKKILLSVQSITKDINIIALKATPILDNVSQVTKRINNITENIENQIDEVVYSINSLRKIADDVIDFEKRLKSKIEEPILDGVSFFTAIIKGIKAFIDRLRR